MTEQTAPAVSSKNSRLKTFVTTFGFIATIGAAEKIGALSSAKSTALETWAKSRNDCRTLLWLIEHGGDLVGPLFILGGVVGILVIVQYIIESQLRWVWWLCATLMIPGYVLFFAADVGFVSVLSFFSKNS